MLPIPNLDDRSFEQLLQEAKELIPRLAPEWTDENVHDPGMTLLELLAWHLEMQQYRINRLSVEYDRKFLALLGGWPLDRQPAKTSVSFKQAELATYLPFGTGVTVGQLYFETARSITIIPGSTAMVILQHDGTMKELSQDFTTGRLIFYPFGETSAIGSTMTMKLERPLPRAMPLSLWIELDRQDASIRIPANYKSFEPSALVQWSYYEEDETGGKWLPVRMDRDETYSLHQSGPILFELPLAMGDVTQLRAEVISGEFDDAPRVKRLVWNEVFTTQGQTWCREERFDGWSEEDRFVGHLEPIQLYLYHALYIHGELQVQYKVDQGWVDVPRENFHIEREHTHVLLTIEPITIIPVGKNSIRVVAQDPEFAIHQYIATGTGISNQSYPLPIPSIYADSILMQVGYAVGSGDIVWQDWEKVLDFDHSTMDSLHYLIDENEHIVFSDGVYGVSPSSSKFRNIRLISYRTGEGTMGNVKEDTIKNIALGHHAIRVTNLFPAYGGRDPETISEALARTKLEVLYPRCGVTEHDLEQRVLEIPGIRIARVKAIGGYHLALSNYPAERAMGHISIVVVPESRKQFPLPSEGLKKGIVDHLEPYRLLTTKHHVIGPEYIKVTIRAVIVVDPHYEGRERELATALNNWLSPGHSSKSMGWEFGKSISKSDVYDYIHSVAGVNYIQDLWIKAEGNQVVQDEGGDIRIPPNGLAYSGEHEIEYILND